MRKAWMRKSVQALREKYGLDEPHHEESPSTGKGKDVAGVPMDVDGAFSFVISWALPPHPALQMRPSCPLHPSPLTL